MVPAEALRVYLRIALHSFGGPAGQIAFMHREFVEKRAWLSERRFLDALNFCMVLPGPEAMQLVTYVGWLMHGTVGGIVAGALFVLPGFLAILALSIAYALFQDAAWLAALFFGLKAAVLAVVLEAVLRLGRRALRSALLVGLAVAAFVAIFFLHVPFPFILLAAAAVGFLSTRVGPTHASGEDDVPATAARAQPGRPWRTALVWTALWWGPILLLVLVVGAGHIFVQEGLFFSQTAVLTFGGAYAVLAYVAQRAVADFGWLTPSEMLDGLGMAETTPGPLIQVVQFVGFMGAFRHPGALDPVVAGILASVIVTWVTFVPCFLWIFLGAPYIERLRRPGLRGAMDAITAAVVGVMLNLAVWFAMHVLFPLQERRLGPVHVLLPTGPPDWAALAIATGAFVALLRWNMLLVLAVATAVGVAISLVG